MSTDRGDDISPLQAEYLLYQNAMAELASNVMNDEELRPGWWDLIRRGFEGHAQDSGAGWIYWFKIIADKGDPLAIQLIKKVTELRLKS